MRPPHSGFVQVGFGEVRPQASHNAVSGPSSATVTLTQRRLGKHARYYWLLLAESHLTKRLFGGMLGRIAGLSLPAG